MEQISLISTLLTQVPGADYPPSYAATMSGQVDAPPGPYPPQAMQQQPQVITQVQYVSAPSFGRNPATLVCPQCQKNITTRTSSEPSTTAWIIGLVLCVIGCVPCCIIPCCMDSMQTVWACLLASHLSLSYDFSCFQVTHSCPSCNSTLGRCVG